MVETEATRNVILEELEGKGEEGDTVGEREVAASVPMVMLRIGEVAEASLVVLLPVSAVEEREILEACKICLLPPLGLMKLLGSLVILEITRNKKNQHLENKSR
ncbi:hypothetical protein JHK82_027551 [Glycine max]|nr:hypothetical protein JHK82_027551 [Glycine max]